MNSTMPIAVGPFRAITLTSIGSAISVTSDGVLLEPGVSEVPASPAVEQPASSAADRDRTQSRESNFSYRCSFLNVHHFVSEGC